MAESDELITLRSEVDSLRMMIFQLQSERGGAGGGGMGGDFFPIGDFGAGGAAAPSATYPFKVRVVDFNKDAATWQLQIYLPACEDILVYQNSHVDPCYSDDLEYPEGAEGYWYNVLCGATDGTLYLKIIKDDEGYNKVSYSIDSGVSGDGVAAIAYISLVYDDDGVLQSVSVEQYVRSALHLGGEAKWKDPDPGYFQEEE